MKKEENVSSDNIKNSQERIKQIVQELKDHDTTKQDLLLNFLQEETSQIFDDQTIQTLENVTKQLKEIKKIKPKRAIPNHIPITLFSDRTLSVLEHVITYLKEQHELSYKDIATLLNRDQRTVWTTYQRARKKRE